MKTSRFAPALLAIVAGLAHGQSSGQQPIAVTPDNFVRAESDRYLANIALKEGGFGNFKHYRDFTPVDRNLGAPARASNINAQMKSPCYQ